MAEGEIDVLDQRLELAAQARKKVSELNNLLNLLYKQGVKVEVDVRTMEISGFGGGDSLEMIHLNLKLYSQL